MPRYTDPDIAKAGIIIALVVIGWFLFAVGMVAWEGVTGALQLGLGT